MSKLTIEEFNKLTEKEKSERYKELDNHDKFLARVSQPLKGVVVGETKITEEDKKWAEELHKQILEKFVNSNKS